MEKKYYDVRDRDDNKVGTWYTTYSKAVEEARKKYGYGCSVREASVIKGLR